MNKAKEWKRAIWQIRFAMAWRAIKTTALELWDVFVAIFTVISAVVIAVLVWAIPVYKFLEFCGIIE